MSVPITVPDTAGTVAEFFTRFAAGDRAGMLELFAPGVDFAVAGSSVVPWAGIRTDPTAVAEFLRIALEDVTTERFEITATLTDGADAVVLGALAHRINRTGRLFACEFALHLRVVGGRIARYHMFEDSHAAERAWRD